MTPRLVYFDRAEFTVADEDWWPRMSPRLLVLLDVFRHALGEAVLISPAEGSLGRRRGPSDSSQHNVDRWGEVRAADVMIRNMRRADQARRAAELAQSRGFTGIGVYPHWRPHPGLHVDVREDRMPGDSSTWGALALNKATRAQKEKGRVAGGQVYLPLSEVVSAFPS